MTTAADQVARLLNLVPYLRSHPGATVAEVAAEFQVPPRQLAKDLNVLWFCGLPGGFADDLMEAHVEEGGAIHLENPAEPIVRPLRLSTREAVALLVALRALAQVPGIADRDAINRALAKLEAAAGDSAQLAGRLSVAFEAREVVLEAAQRALAENRALRIQYYVPSRDEVTTRDVDPMRVALLGGRAYLEAWCRSSEAVRLFRLDRVSGISVLPEPARVPERAQPLDLDDETASPAPRPDAQGLLLVLDLGPAAHWVPEYYPCEAVEERTGGGLRVRLRAADPDRIRRLVLRLGPAARVVEPAAFAEDVAATARAALAGYGVSV